MKKLVIASFILVTSLIVSNANAQAYVGVKIGWAAPPIPVLVAPPIPPVYGPRVVYAPPVPYYRTEVPSCYGRDRAYYRDNDKERYYQGYDRDRYYRDSDRDRWHRHHREW